MIVELQTMTPRNQITLAKILQIVTPNNQRAIA
jgi:hypothetical protein